MPYKPKEPQLEHTGRLESKQSRAKKLLAAFGWLSAGKLGLNVAVEGLDPNVMSLSGLAMSGYDSALTATGAWAIWLRNRGHELSASGVRTVAALGHIAVATYGANVALERGAAGTTGSWPGLVGTLATAGVGGYLIGREIKVHREEQAKGLYSADNPNHEFSHNLVKSSTFEAIATSVGALGQLATHHPAIAEASVVATAVGVGGLMAKQVVENEVPLWKQKLQQWDRPDQHMMPEKDDAEAVLLRGEPVIIDAS